ncbi:MAG: SH3 domain-containing protein [Candidatus Saganbacteria bacterium]|nr:SH3 domain-containing protein [Candidatus Saganbacteria bacterium]
MRKFLTIVFLLLLFFSTSAVAAVWSTRYDGVKLYKNPDTSSYELFDYPINFPLKIVASSGNWYKVVDWMRLRGWVKKSQLKNVPGCVVSRRKINFRSGPGRGYRNIGKLFQGNVLRVLRTTKYWAKVKVSDPNTGQVGWVHRRLLWGI